MDCSIRFTAPGAKPVKETEKAFRVSVNSQYVWIPKSIQHGDIKSQVDIPLWYALIVGLAHV